MAEKEQGLKSDSARSDCERRKPGAGRFLLRGHMVRVEEKTHRRVDDAKPEKPRVLFIAGQQVRFIVGLDVAQVLQQFRFVVSSLESRSSVFA